MVARRTATEAAGECVGAAVALPVSPSTLLGLELLAQRPALDLRAAARLVRGDPGAVLAVFGVFREECGEPDTVRFEDCLASVSHERLLRALASGRSARRPRFAAFAEHAVAVGQSAGTVAEALGLSAELAQLVGLLHELGRAPDALGWKGWPADATACCDRLARAASLPPMLRQALDEVHRRQPRSVWVAVIAAAHELLPPASGGARRETTAQQPSSPAAEPGSRSR